MRQVFSSGVVLRGPPAPTPKTQQTSDGTHTQTAATALKASVAAHTLSARLLVLVPYTKNLGGAGLSTHFPLGVADQRHVLQQFVHLSQPARKHAPVVATPCRSYRFPRIVLAAWHVGLALHFQCFMSGTFCHCAMPAGCAAFPHVFLFKLTVTTPHRVLY